MGKKSLTKSTAKKKKPTEKKPPVKDVDIAVESSTKPAAKTTATADPEKKKPAAKKPTLKTLLKKDFGAWNPPALFSAATDTASANYTAPPFVDAVDPAQAKAIRALLAKQFDLTVVEASEAPEKPAKKKAAPATKTAPKPAEKAVKKPVLSLEELLNLKFDPWRPETLFTPATDPEQQAVYAAPAFVDPDHPDAASITALLAKQFDLSVVEPIETPVPAKPVSVEKPVEKAVKKPVLSLEELLNLKFDPWRPETLFTPATDPEQQAVYVAPAFVDPDHPDAANIKALLAKQFDLSVVEPIETPVPAKPVSVPEAPVEATPESATQAVEPAAAPAEPAPEPEPIPQPISEPEPAPAPEPEPAPAPIQAPEPEPVKEPEKPAPEAPVAAVETPKPMAETIPAPKPVEPPKPAEPPKAPEKPKTEAKKEAPKAPAKPAPKPAAEKAPEPASPVTPPADFPASPKPPATVSGPVKMLISGMAAVFALLIIASAMNSGKYYLNPAENALEIWQGTFSPSGKALIATVPGTTVPEPLKSVYSKKEALAPAYDHYMKQADTLSHKKGRQDADAIKGHLYKAIRFAPTLALRDAAKSRVHQIDAVLLIEQAGIAAAKGTLAGYESAINDLNQAKNMGIEEAQRVLVDEKLAKIKKAKKLLEGISVAPSKAAQPH